MTARMESITVHLPSSALRRLRRVAEIAQRPLNDVISQTLEATLPPLPEDMPVAIQQELAALETLSNADLRRQMRARYDADALQRYDELLAANAGGALDEAGRQELARLRGVADLLMFRKAYAALLLKWRGQRVPTLTELENAQ